MASADVPPSVGTCSSSSSGKGRKKTYYCNATKPNKNNASNMIWRKEKKVAECLKSKAVSFQGSFQSGHYHHFKHGNQ
jgi:hypothetical protein